MINCLTISKFQQPLEIINELGTEINYNFIYEDIYFYKQFITNNPTDGYTLDLFNKITNEVSKIKHRFSSGQRGKT